LNWNFFFINTGNLPAFVLPRSDLGFRGVASPFAASNPFFFIQDFARKIFSAPSAAGCSVFSFPPFLLHDIPSWTSSRSNPHPFLRFLSFPPRLPLSSSFWFRGDGRVYSPPLGVPLFSDLFGGFEDSMEALRCWHDHAVGEVGPRPTLLPKFFSPSPFSASISRRPGNLCLPLFFNWKAHLLRFATSPSSSGPLVSGPFGGERTL